jgi:hypothetical protein
MVLALQMHLVLLENPMHLLNRLVQLLQVILASLVILELLFHQDSQIPLEVQ